MCSLTSLTIEHQFVGLHVIIRYAAGKLVTIFRCGYSIKYHPPCRVTLDHIINVSTEDDIRMYPSHHITLPPRVPPITLKTLETVASHIMALAKPHCLCHYTNTIK